MTQVLQVTDVSGGYTGAPILRDVCAAVGADEAIGLLGANGAGKTSLLRAVSGNLPITRGRISICGTSIDKMSPWNRVRAGIAHVPEGRRVFAALTVRENLEVASLVTSRKRGSCDDAFELFPRLRERQGQPAGSLSGGEQQMLAIGRALMTRPKLLLIDEMSAGLAPVLVEQLVAGLAELRRRSVAMLIVEQSPSFIADLVDRVYLLDHGRIVREGTMSALGGVTALSDLYLGVR